VRYGVNGPWDQLEERLKGEAPEAQAWMRKVKAWGSKDDAPKDQKV